MRLGIVLAACAVFLLAEDAPRIAPAGAPAKVTIAAAAEPGDRLTVQGVVYGSDGQPLAGASVYVYHTDEQGLYSAGVNDSRNPRLRGYLRTDALGRYEYTTIRPASYPNSSNPAHIHYHVNAPGHAERIFEIVFEGDPFVSADIRARAAREDSGFSIRPLAKETGVWRCRQDVRLRAQRQ